MSLSECRVLLGHILEQFDGLYEVLRRASTRDLGLGTAVHQILLGQLHQEISVQLDVEVEIGRGSLGLLDVQIERGVKQSDSLDFVAS